MAFTKTGIAVNKPQILEGSIPKPGTKMDGKVWDGENWVTEEEWASIKASLKEKKIGG